MSATDPDPDLRYASGDITREEWIRLRQRAAAVTPKPVAPVRPLRPPASNRTALLVVSVALVVALVAAVWALGLSPSRGAAASYVMGTVTQGSFAATSPPPDLGIDPGRDTIRGNGSDIPLTLEGTPLWDSRPGDYFLAYGLVNPTLVLPVGATVHFLFINMDNETHTFAVTTLAPPYSSMPMMEGGMMSAGGGQWLAMSPIVPGVPSYDGNGTRYQDVEVTMTFPNAGTFWYLCLYPGHAAMGMYGDITVQARA